MNIVDTHVHLYDDDESTYPMLAEPSRPEPGIGSMRHLQREMQGAGVSRAVIVQTGSAYGFDNRLMLDAVGAHREWAVGVCRLDPSNSGSPGLLEQYVSTANVRGLRMEPVGELYPMFYNPGATRMWLVARRLGIVVCANLRAKLLTQLADLLSRFPDVPVVLDHAAYPSAAEPSTFELVKELARFRNLHLKLSFAVNGSQMGYPFPDMHAGVKLLIDAFGADRCMWGSNFPCEHWLKKASYAEHLDLFRREFKLSDGQQQAILEETPMRVWFGS